MISSASTAVLVSKPQPAPDPEVAYGWSEGAEILLDVVSREIYLSMLLCWDLRAPGVWEGSLHFLSPQKISTTPTLQHKFRFPSVKRGD